MAGCIVVAITVEGIVLRLWNWQSLLEREFAEARKRAFAWGQHDCCAFALRCVDAMRGTDLRRLYVTYDDEASAVDEIARRGGVAAAVEAFGEAEMLTSISASLAQRGDVGLTDSPDERFDAAVVVCAGDMWFGPVAPGGIARVSPTKIWRAWRV